MATANLMVRLDNGAPQVGGIVTTPGTTVQLVAASYAGWGSPAPRWEILTYPPGWSTPSGWTLDTSSGAIYYLGTSPPSFTLPSAGQVTNDGLFGVWRFALTVNGGGSPDLVDRNRTAVEIISDNGVRDVAFGERAEFNPQFAHAVKVATNNRVLDQIAVTAVVLGNATPSAIVASSPSAGTSPDASHQDHTHALPESVFRTVAGTITSALGVNGQRVSGMGTPISTTDATTKGFEDARENAFPYKLFARGASTANQTLNGPLTEDGITYQNGDLYLDKNQTTGSQNGLYEVNIGGAWTRHAAMATNSHVANGMVIGVREGTINQSTGWQLDTPAPITIGTTSLTFVRVWAPAYTFGNGLNSSGYTIFVQPTGDGSVVVGPGGVGVGVLASDAQHGTRGGGSQHALAVAGSPGTAGFIGGPDIQAVQSRSTTATANSLVLRTADGGTSLAFVAANPTLLNPSNAKGLIRALNTQVVLGVRNAGNSDDLDMVSVANDGLVIGVDSTESIVTCTTGGTSVLAVRSTTMVGCVGDGVGLLSAPSVAGGSGVVSIAQCTSEPTSQLNGSHVVCFLRSLGALSVLTKDNVQCDLTPSVSGDVFTKTQKRGYVARLSQASATGPSALLSIPLGNSVATLVIDLTVVGKHADATIVRRRSIVINNETPGNVVTADTVGTDVNTIGGGSAVSLGVVGSDYVVSVQSSTVASVDWVAFADVKYNEV